MTNPIEMAKLESSITGVVAGFALTIVVLLIDRLTRKSVVTRHEEVLGKAAVLVFVGTFFTATLASFLFAVVGSQTAEPPHIPTKVYILFLLPGFAFALSSLLLVLGLILILGAYRIRYVAGHADMILYSAIILITANYSNAVLAAIAQILNESTLIVLSKLHVSLSLVGIPAILVFAGLVVRWYLYRHRPVQKSFESKGLRAFMYACITLCVVMGVLLPVIDNQPSNLSLPTWLLLLFSVGYSVLAAWAVIYAPRLSEP